MNIRFNKILSAVALAAATTLTTSCDSLFNDAPINVISEKSIWKNPLLLDEYENSWYRNMSNGFDTYVPSLSLFKARSRYFMPWFGDQITVGKSNYFNAGYGDILKGNETQITNWAANQWSKYYTQIQYINTLFENLNEVSNGDQKNRIIGEAHFMRGYYYYMLWRMFGGVMIIDHTYNPLIKEEKFPRASYQQMVDFIVNEADEAAKYLPQVHPTTETGRATLGVALMLKAKTYLWASSKVFQNKEADKTYLGFADDQSRNMLEKAKKAYEELFALRRTASYLSLRLRKTAYARSIATYSSPRTRRSRYWRCSTLTTATSQTSSDTSSTAMQLRHSSPATRLPTPPHRTMWTSMACRLARHTMPNIRTTTATTDSTPTSCTTDAPTATT